VRSLFSKGIRFLLHRAINPDDIDDKVHDVLLIVLHAIMAGTVRDPSRLAGYVRGIVKRHIATYVDTDVRLRQKRVDLDLEGISNMSLDPETAAITKNEEAIAMRVLQSLPKRHCELLIRFYLREEAPEDICRSLKLTDTQFRLIKSRAKARFAELGKHRFALRSRPEPSLPGKISPSAATRNTTARSIRSA
jgi:RNA polymerase sigma-70 factor, ECF subfamily